MWDKMDDAGSAMPGNSALQFHTRWAFGLRPDFNELQFSRHGEIVSIFYNSIARLGVVCLVMAIVAGVV
jgi:hypothetical protein